VLVYRYDSYSFPSNLGVLQRSCAYLLTQPVLTSNKATEHFNTPTSLLLCLYTQHQHCFQASYSTTDQNLCPFRLSRQMPPICRGCPECLSQDSKLLDWLNDLETHSKMFDSCIQVDPTPFERIISSQVSGQHYTITATWLNSSTP
jgi:hypothetical protein